MNLWIVGQYKADTSAGRVWEFAGVFDTQELAVAACRDYTYFVQPIVLNEAAPHESFEFEGGFYPYPGPEVSEVKEIPDESD